MSTLSISLVFRSDSAQQCDCLRLLVNACTIRTQGKELVRWEELRGGRFQLLTRTPPERLLCEALRRVQMELWRRLGVSQFRRKNFSETQS